MIEVRFGLQALQKGSRRFKFAVPVEVVDTRNSSGELSSLQCDELGILASSPEEFVTMFAEIHDGLLNLYVGHLTPRAQSLRAELKANVTEEARTPGLSDDYWIFNFAWHGSPTEEP